MPRRHDLSIVAPVLRFLEALAPSLGVLLIFWLGIRALLQADRRERIAQARIESAASEAGQPSADLDPEMAIEAAPVAQNDRPESN
jgi:hypothetical protein